MPVFCSNELLHSEERAGVVLSEYALVFAREVPLGYAGLRIHALIDGEHVGDGLTDDVGKL